MSQHANAIVYHSKSLSGLLLVAVLSKKVNNQIKVLKVLRRAGFYMYAVQIKDFLK
jgi:hypothetical protein